MNARAKQNRNIDESYKRGFESHLWCGWLGAMLWSSGELSSRLVLAGSVTRNQSIAE